VTSGTALRGGQGAAGVLAYWHEYGGRVFAEVFWDDGVRWRTGVLGQYGGELYAPKLFGM